MLALHINSLVSTYRKAYDLLAYEVRQNGGTFMTASSKVLAVPARHQLNKPPAYT